MLSCNKEEIIDSFWSSFINSGLNKSEWIEVYTDQYHFNKIFDKNGRLATDRLLQNYSFRIPCDFDNIRLYVYKNESSICIMFYEDGSGILYIHSFMKEGYIL